MNILKAKNQLHQIAKNNPETDHFNFSQPNSVSPDTHLTSTWKAQRHPKILHAQHPQTHLFKDENIKTIPLKTNSQQKMQVKTPIFKNKKGEDFSLSQKQRFEKLGLENFLKQSLVDKRLMDKHEEPIEQKIIKNLNNTYFRSTEHIHGKRKNMANSLGIKKSSMSNYKVDWDEKNIDELEIEWKYIGYIPNKVFPSRKNTSVKNKIYKPKKKQSPKKDTKDSGDKTKINDVSLMQKTNSASFLQSKDLGAKNSLLYLNEKVTSLQSSRTMHKDKKVFLNSSKTLNKSQQLVIKAQISRVFIIDRVRPMSEKSKRPWTSKQALMRNQKISEKLNFIENASRKRRYSESINRTFQTFKQSWKQDSKKSVVKNVEIENGSDFIKGKKMNIHQVPEQRPMEYF